MSFTEMDDVIPDLSILTEETPNPIQHGLKEEVMMNAPSSQADTESEVVVTKKRRGRPKGSKNKVKAASRKIVAKAKKHSLMKTPSPKTKPKRYQVSTPTSSGEVTPKAAGGLFARNLLVSPPSPVEVPVPVSDVESESDFDDVQRELYEGEGTEPIPYTRELKEVLIKVCLPAIKGYNLAKSKAEKERIWEDIEGNLIEKGFPGMIKGRGKDLRRQYLSLLKTHKEIEDWNCQSGRNRRSFKYSEAFYDAINVAKEDAPQVDVTVDVGTEPAASSTMQPRKHPRGKKTNDTEQQKLQLLKMEVESKVAYMEKMLENDNKKIELLEKLVNHITSQ